MTFRKDFLHTRYSQAVKEFCLFDYIFIMQPSWYCHTEGKDAPKTAFKIAFSSKLFLFVNWHSIVTTLKCKIAEFALKYLSSFPLSVSIFHNHVWIVSGQLFTKEPPTL